MRRIVFLAALLLCATVASAQIRGRHRKLFPSGGGGGIAVTCSLGAGSFSGTSATVNIAAPSGSLVVVGVGTLLTANFTSLQDNLLNNINPDTSSWVGSSGVGFTRFFHEVSTGITSVKATFAAGTNQIAVEACYVTGLTNNAADAIDNTGNVSPGVSATFTTGAMTTTNAADVIFGLGYDGGNTTTASGTSPWILGDTHPTAGSYSAWIIYQIVSATGTYTPTGALSPSAAYSGIGASYK